MRRAANPRLRRSPRSRGLLPLLAAATCTVVGAGALFGGVLRSDATADAGGDRAAPLIARGVSLLDRARATGNPALYGSAEKVLVEAEAVDGRSSEAQAALASLALLRHQFEVALVHAERARMLAPHVSQHHALVGDALIELGRYREAFAAFDRMATIRPGLAAYARVAYARELVGRPGAALQAHRLAIEAAGPRPTVKAAALAQLGELHISTGRLDGAEAAFRSALRVSPGFGAALEGLAHVEGSRGNYGRAIRLARHAGAAGTETLGDLYLLTGRNRLAEREYAKSHAFARKEARHGVRIDLEVAEFAADHGVRLGEAVTRARRAHRMRPSIDADSVLGWALTRNGRCREALPYAHRALRLGTKDAEALFRRGMVDRCLGRPASAARWFARAVAVSPHFSLLWSPAARRYAVAAYDS